MCLSDRFIDRSRSAVHHLICLVQIIISVEGSCPKLEATIPNGILVLCKGNGMMGWKTIMKKCWIILVHTGSCHRTRAGLAMKPGISNL